MKWSKTIETFSFCGPPSLPLPAEEASFFDNVSIAFDHFNGIPWPNGQIWSTCFYLPATNTSFTIGRGALVRKRFDHFWGFYCLCKVKWPFFFCHRCFRSEIGARLCVKERAKGGTFVPRRQILRKYSGGFVSLYGSWVFQSYFRRLVKNYQDSRRLMKIDGDSWRLSVGSQESVS